MVEMAEISPLVNDGRRTGKVAEGRRWYGGVCVGGGGGGSREGRRERGLVEC